MDGASHVGIFAVLLLADDLHHRAGGLGHNFHLAGLHGRQRQVVGVTGTVAVEYRGGEGLAVEHGGRHGLIGGTVVGDLGRRADDIVGDVTQFVECLQAHEVAAVGKDERQFRQLLQHLPDGGDVQPGTIVAVGVVTTIVDAVAAAVGNRVL